jgi:hypothetical protein
MMAGPNGISTRRAQPLIAPTITPGQRRGGNGAIDATGDKAGDGSQQEKDEQGTEVQQGNDERTDPAEVGRMDPEYREVGDQRGGERNDAGDGARADPRKQLRTLPGGRAPGLIGYGPTSWPLTSPAGCFVVWTFT